MRSTKLATRVVALAAVGAVTLGIHFAGSSAGHDWPQFRGPNRDGVSAETGLIVQWPEAGPKEVWRVEIGEGYSSISVVGDRLYTMYAAEQDGEPTEFAAAFEASSGKELWRTPVGKKFDNQFGNGPRATPAVDGDTVYVLGSLGNLAALSTKDGSARWQVLLTELVDAKVPTFGFSTSALVDGDQLVLEGGGKEGKSYIALDKKTGEVKWTFGDGPEEPGYSSVLLVDMKGEKRYVYIVGEKMICLDDAGNEIWTKDWPKGETHAMPLFIAPNKIFASGAEGVGAQMVEVDESGDTPTVKEIWASPHMRNHFSSSVYQKGSIFGFDNATLKAISDEDAKLLWAKRGLGKGSLILADGHLIVLSDRGQLLQIDATADAYKEQGKVQALEGRSWTAPTLSRGILYLRNHTEMVAYDLKG